MTSARTLLLVVTLVAAPSVAGDDKGDWDFGDMLLRSGFGLNSVVEFCLASKS